jgi:HEAT repeat protein
MMLDSSWFARLEHLRTSYLLFGLLAGGLVAAGVLHRLGVLAWALGGVGQLVRGVIRIGFLLWESLLAWATWPLFLAVVLAFLMLGVEAGSSMPGLRVLFGMAPMFMGAIACFAYMTIDQERSDVERGYKAVHNPLKGQLHASYLDRYGRHVGIPLLICSTIAVIGGFALLNQGLYETVGRSWYRVGDPSQEPIYIDFLAYAITRILNLMDVLDLAKSHHLLAAEAVRQAKWPASTLLVGFKLFFTLVLVHQISASLRQGKLLAETIADFWSPHQPIHERARNALPVYGSVAIGPLLASLRSIPSLTKEQRDQLPLILETIGPSVIPTLVRHLHDPHEHVRGIAVAALGHLHASETVSSIVGLLDDPSDSVRQSVVEALGTLGSPRPGAQRPVGFVRRRRGLPNLRVLRLLAWRRRGEAAGSLEPTELAIAALERALNDPTPAVRTAAAASLGKIGRTAAAVAPRLIEMLEETDETMRCQAALALGEIGAESEAALAALVGLLGDPSATVRVAGAQALGKCKGAASPALPCLVPLLQDRDEAVRTAAAEAIAQVGPLDEQAAGTLVEGLGSPDNMVRAQTAEVLGTIGPAAEEAAPALVEAVADLNDRVRVMAVEALGKIGESAAETAVPGLLRALDDQDNLVSAKAAEALGQMGESGGEAVPALVASLSHINPQVRRNAAEALGNLKATVEEARAALEAAAGDEDGGVRSQAILALGMIGEPTDSSVAVVLSGFRDADPQVRAASVKAVGRWGRGTEDILSSLVPLLEDVNDEVKVETLRALPRLAGATEEVIGGLCRLLEDDSEEAQAQAALALGKLGPAAASAGEALCRAAQTAQVGVREQALRAMAMIQPPETAQAFIAGLSDANAAIRIVASAGWIKAPEIPAEAIPALVDALRDPEVRVRANAAGAIARLDSIPVEAIPLLIESTADADDGLRLNAATALKMAPIDEVVDVMRHLIADPNSRVRLIAASSLLSREEIDAHASTVLVEALADPSLRVREAALALFESLGPRGVAVLEALLKEHGFELDATAQDEPADGSEGREDVQEEYLQRLSSGNGSTGLPAPQLER